MTEREKRVPQKKVSLLKPESKLEPVNLSDEQRAREALLDAEITVRFESEHNLPQMERLSDGVYHLHIAGQPEGAESEGIALNEGQPNDLENIQRELDNPNKYWRSPQEKK